MSHLHQPCCFIHIFGVDYNLVPYKVRQKISVLNQKLITLNSISGMHYVLYLDTEYITLVNVTYNKILFYEPINPSFAVALFRIEQLIEFHRLEHAPFTTIYQQNHYLSLKKQYYE